jgi:hypothetical protein
VNTDAREHQDSSQVKNVEGKVASVLNKAPYMKSYGGEEIYSTHPYWMAWCSNNLCSGGARFESDVTPAIPRDIMVFSPSMQMLG